MNKLLKKVIALAGVLMLVLALSAPAFAALGFFLGWGGACSDISP